MLSIAKAQKDYYLRKLGEISPTRGLLPAGRHGEGSLARQRR